MASLTPCSKALIHKTQLVHMSMTDANVSHVFKKTGFCNPIKISDTLQGSIWKASIIQNGLPNPEAVVIKITNRYKHRNCISVIGNKVYPIKEDILLEQSILKYLTQQKECPKSIVKFIWFFKSNTNFFFVMEHGGFSLFEFVKKGHQLIRANKIEISHWLKVIKVISEQMVDCIKFIHSHKICHNDISLDNLLINDVEIEVEYPKQHEKIKFNTNNIQIKLCDFGLAELHTNDDCLSDKYCGKREYRSPEVVNRNKRFKGKKNDVWCVGVCLFILSFGFPPWNVAHVNDDSFNYIMNGCIGDLLMAWGYSQFMDPNLIDLMDSIFKYEEHRINLKEIKAHPWFN